MRFFLICCLAMFAMRNAEECSEERAEVCLEKVLEALIGSRSREEACSGLEDSVDCLRALEADCENDEDLSEAINELEKNMKTGCQENNDFEIDEEMLKCVDENEDYFHECIFESVQKTLQFASIIGKDADENFLKCGMYGLMATCYAERAEEKCGPAARPAMLQEFKDAPKEFEEACEESEIGDMFEPKIHLLERKK